MCKIYVINLHWSECVIELFSYSDYRYFTVCRLRFMVFGYHDFMEYYGRLENIFLAHRIRHEDVLASCVTVFLCVFTFVKFRLSFDVKCARNVCMLVIILNSHIFLFFFCFLLNMHKLFKADGRWEYIESKWVCAKSTT